MADPLINVLTCVVICHVGPRLLPIFLRTHPWGNEITLASDQKTNFTGSGQAATLWEMQHAVLYNNNQ